MLNIAVVGYGFWGPLLVRNFQKNPDAQVVAVVDGDVGQRNRVMGEHPSIAVYESTDDLYASQMPLDAVAIATPLSTHFDLALQALDEGYHVFVEKPMAASAKEAEEINEVANASGLVVGVDHTFVYDSSITKLKMQIATQEIGDLWYMDLEWANVGTNLPPSLGVLEDFGPHPIAIMLHLLGEKFKPRSVQAIGQRVMDNGPNKCANMYVMLELDHLALAHMSLSWLSPRKIRRVVVGGSQFVSEYSMGDEYPLLNRYYGHSHLLPSTGMKLKDLKGSDVLLMPPPPGEPLYGVTDEFVQRALGNKNYGISTGDNGVEVCKIIDAANESYVNGAKVKL